MSEIRIANLTITDAVVQYDPSKGTITLPAPQEVKEAVEPKFQMWKPENGADYYVYNGVVAEKWCRADCNGIEDSVMLAHWRAGKFYPTAEICNVSGEINKLTALLTQAVISYGGKLSEGVPDYEFISATRAVPRTQVGYFKSEEMREAFESVLFTEIGRLSKLRIKLEDLWKPHLMQAQEGVVNGSQR